MSGNRHLHVRIPRNPTYESQVNLKILLTFFYNVLIPPRIFLGGTNNNTAVSNKNTRAAFADMAKMASDPDLSVKFKTLATLWKDF